MLPEECEQSWDSRSASRFFFVPQALGACHRLYDAFGKLDIDCYKSGDDGAGKCSTENVKQGVRKGQHDFDATRENQKKKHNTQGWQAHSQARPAKKTHPVRDKNYKTHYFSLEAAEPKGWTISQNLRSLIPKATEQMQQRYQNKNTTEN